MGGRAPGGADPRRPRLGRPGHAAAGAIFVGPYSPVSLGDYLAGSNHVLPTGGTARHTGGLSVQSFLHGVHVVEYDEGALAGAAAHIDALGGAEDLPAHVAAVRVRVPRSEPAQDEPVVSDDREAAARRRSVAGRPTVRRSSTSRSG